MNNMTGDMAQRWIDWHDRKQGLDWENRLRNDGVNISQLDPEEVDLRQVGKRALEWYLDLVEARGYSEEEAWNDIESFLGSSVFEELCANGYL